MARKVLLFAHILVIVAGVLGILANYTSPVSTKIPAYFGFFFPLVLILNLIAFMSWLMIDRKLAWISVIVFAAFGPFLFRTFSFSFGKSAEEEFKIMSYNVKNFDLYDWNENPNARVEIIKLVRDEQPDIACFQEFYDADRGEHLNIAAIEDAMGESDYAFATTFDQQGSRFGVALFSKFPILDWQAIPLLESKNNTAMYADLLVKGDTLRVFNVHLQSINLGYDDYDYLNSPQGNQPEVTRKIVFKLNRGLETRAKQAEQLQDSIEGSPYPVLVCGDFNDGPMSYTYSTIKGDLNDAFVRKGMGFGQTYNELSFPILRIDFILPSDELKVLNYKTLHEDLSDHYPIVAGLKWD